MWVKIGVCVGVSIVGRACSAWFELLSKCVTDSRVVVGVVRAWTLVSGLQHGYAPLDASSGAVRTVW